MKYYLCIVLGLMCAPETKAQNPTQSEDWITLLTRKLEFMEKREKKNEADIAQLRKEMDEYHAWRKKGNELPPVPKPP